LVLQIEDGKGSKCDLSRRHRNERKSEMVLPNLQDQVRLQLLIEDTQLFTWITSRR
jgi:hypothetical protein